MIFCKCGKGASRRGPDGRYWCMGCFEAKAWECRDVSRAERLTAAREAVVEAAKEWTRLYRSTSQDEAESMARRVDLFAAVAHLLEVEKENG